MTKISNQYSLTNVLTADPVNGRVGIGTATPVTKLEVNGSVNITAAGNLFCATTSGIFFSGFNSYAVGIYNDNTGILRFATATTERMRITAAGNVGIGTTSPVATLSMPVSTTNSQISTGSIEIQSLAVNNSWLADNMFYNGSGFVSRNAGWTHQIYFGDSSGIRFLTGTSSISAGASSNATERMRITSGGDVYVGATTFPGAGFATTGVAFGQSGFISSQRNAATVGYFGRGTNDGELFAFFRGTTQVGNISVTTSATSYNTNSDYRLKEDFKPINGLEKISAIKVYDFKWKGEEYRMDGVLAHELAEVLPYAVHGKKDGKEMQSVDYSKIVPVLISSIQEQQTQINELKALLNA